MTFQEYLSQKGLAPSSMSIYIRNAEQALLFMDCPGEQ